MKTFNEYLAEAYQMEMTPVEAVIYAEEHMHADELAALEGEARDSAV